MIAYVYPADLYGCGAYRLIFPAQALALAGHKVIVVPPQAQTGIGGEVDPQTGQLTDVHIPADADLIVLQRVTLNTLGQAIPMLRKRGIAVVVDMDDDLTKIDPSNVAFQSLHPKTGRTPLHNWANATRAAMDATLVTVSTDALLKVYAPHGRGVVLYNRIPAQFLDVPHADSERFGWPGSVHSHPVDLQEIGPAAARLVREGFSYWGVGPSEGLRQALGFGPDEDVDVDVSGSVKLEEWPHAVASLGVGIAPLADTKFNAAKSWLKVLEMSAVGVPWVASPRAEYLRFQRAHGVGLMAATPKDWYRMVKRLLTDRELRADESELGREAARLNTIEAHAWRWAEAWEYAYETERRNRPARKVLA
jgi:hypothetical protein